MAQVNATGEIDLMSDLVYQRGGIVSRILLKQPTGSVTAFAFDAGQELSEHTCPYEALLQVLEGEGQITIDGTPYIIAAGHMIYLPAHVPHAVAATHQMKMILTMLRSEKD